MVDIYTDPLFTPAELSKTLLVPRSTVYTWLKEIPGQTPLVHSVKPELRGFASVPFIAVVETFVLRSLRDLQMSKPKIRQAVLDVRREFDNPYGLASKRIATDGVDIFIEHADGSMARAGDHQTPIREVIESYLKYIRWSDDGTPNQLVLPQYSAAAPVVVDPRFSWGAPIVKRNRVPVRAVIDLFRAGESIGDVADEYDLSPDEVEAICRGALARAA